MIEYVSCYEFAKRKNVSHNAVYKRLKTDKNVNGDIVFTLIGKIKYIDWDKYKTLKFKKWTL